MITSYGLWINSLSSLHIDINIMSNIYIGALSIVII